MMLVAHELGKTIDEVSLMPSQEIYQWVAFLQLRQEEEQKAIDRYKRKHNIR